MLESSTWHRQAHTFWDYVDYDLAETTLKSDPSMLSLPLLLLLNEAIELPPPPSFISSSESYCNKKISE